MAGKINKNFKPTSHQKNVATDEMKIIARYFTGREKNLVNNYFYKTKTQSRYTRIED